MTASAAAICGISYAMGERTHSFQDALSFEQILIEKKIVNDPKLFGWGNYFATNKSVESLGIEAARKTLSTANIDPTAIDYVIFCCTNFRDFGELGCERTYHQILSELHLERTFILGVSLNNCTTLLSAIHVASMLLLDERYSNILVISSDKVHEEKLRFTESCLYSDAAVSFVVSRVVKSGFTVLGDAFLSNHNLISHKSAIADLDINRMAHSALIHHCGPQPISIRKVFTNNLFLPIVKFKEANSDVSPDALYLDNIPRIGHCFAADPLINLADFEQHNSIQAGETFLLTSSSTGLRAALAIQYVQTKSGSPASC